MGDSHFVRVSRWVQEGIDTAHERGVEVRTVAPYSVIPALQEVPEAAVYALQRVRWWFGDLTESASHQLAVRRLIA